RAPADASGWATPTTTALARVKRDLGVLVAHEVASRLSSAGASALNSAFVKGTAASSTQRVRAAVQWFEANCTHAVQVADVARMAAMSERNFLRCFKVETGLTPLKFLLRARLELTSTLLVSTDLSLDGIAKRCGWRGGETMARVFVKRFACTPAEYRVRARLRMPKVAECNPIVQGAN
ncbi:AraC family transcriptional regulator, partial [Paraburkholderia sp. Ac-20347]|uniref:helix-turn-helix domain-containing protein n=1 Tax=Paraburkholderia sp. Ac-20347 TaxID=2703892 RepID=UPI00197FB5F7